VVSDFRYDLSVTEVCSRLHLGLDNEKSARYNSI